MKDTNNSNKTSLEKKFTFLKHTADVKFQAFGNTLEEAFKNSAIAMFYSMYDGNIKKSKEVSISVEGKDFENLLYNFLEEFLFLLDTEGFFLADVADIKIEDCTNNNGKLKLKAIAVGDDAKNYHIHTHVKAVTYNEMFVGFDKEKDQWVAQVVLDV